MGGAALPTLSGESLALGTSGAPLLLLPPPPLPPRPRVGTEAAAATAGRPSTLILYLQAADGHDGPPAERAGGSDGGGSPALDAGMAERMPARVHASGAFEGTQADGAGVPPRGHPGGSRRRRLMPGRLQCCCWDSVSSQLLVGLDGCRWQDSVAPWLLAGHNVWRAVGRTRWLGCCPQDSTSRVPLAVRGAGI